MLQSVCPLCSTGYQCEWSRWSGQRGQQHSERSASTWVAIMELSSRCSAVKRHSRIIFSFQWDHLIWHPTPPMTLRAQLDLVSKEKLSWTAPLTAVDGHLLLHPPHNAYTVKSESLRRMSGADFCFLKWLYNLPDPCSSVISVCWGLHWPYTFRCFKQDTSERVEKEKEW